MKKTKVLLGLAAIAAIVSAIACAQHSPTFRMTTEIPAAITTPDEVHTRLGTLKFFDGAPSTETVDLVYENLDFLRGVEAFLNAIPVASLYAVREGMREAGAVNGTIGIYENLMDSKSLFLTPNTESVYTMSWLDLKDGPVVVESPPNVLGIVDDFWFRYVCDMGNAGPDRGQGGKFLFLPPGYEGDVPDGYHVYQSQTYGNTLLWRGFLVDGDPAPAVASIKQHARIYPLAQADNPPEQAFVDMSGMEINTIHANDYTFYEEVNTIIQEEPTEAGDPETLGLLASIGIVKGQPFAPDTRMTKILTEAAAVANATARAQIYASRDSRTKYYKDSHWSNFFVGNSYEFLSEGARLLDARSMFFYYATMVTPAMTIKKVGVGSQYAGTFRDVDGEYLDGGKSYKVHLPAGVPAQDFWSLVVYDNQTRSMLQTEQQYTSAGRQRGVQANADGSYDIWFGPEAPTGKESNWIQTIPGKGWSVILRLYGPLETWFDQTWRPGEVTPVG